MAYYAQPGSEDDANFLAQRNQNNKAFQQYINTPQGMQDYNNQMAQNWNAIQSHTGAYQDFGGGGLLDSIGKILDPIMSTAISATPYVLGASLGDAALGALGGAGAATTTDAGTGGLQSIAAGATPTATGGDTLGSMLGGSAGVDAGIPTVSVVGHTAGTGIGDILGAGAAGASIGSVLSDPGTIPQDPSLSNVPNIPGPEGDIPTVVVSGAPGGTNAAGTIVAPPINYTPPVVPVPLQPGVGDVPNIPGSSTGGGTPTVGGLPGSIDPTKLLGGLGSILGAASGYQMNQADKDYWQNLMNKAMGMYMPGTPEADMLEHKMEAQDAAAGRNSQYGIREQNLAALLGQQRANIMMSPTFYRMGEASRGHYDDSLNSIFGGLGALTGGGSSSTLNNLFGIGSNFWNSGLGGLFGGSNSGSNGSVDNTLF